MSLCYFPVNYGYFFLHYHYLSSHSCIFILAIENLCPLLPLFFFLINNTAVPLSCHLTDCGMTVCGFLFFFFFLICERNCNCGTAFVFELLTTQCHTRREGAAGRDGGRHIKRETHRRWNFLYIVFCKMMYVILKLVSQQKYIHSVARAERNLKSLLIKHVFFVICHLSTVSSLKSLLLLGGNVCLHLRTLSSLQNEFPCFSSWG